MALLREKHWQIMMKAQYKHYLEVIDLGHSWFLLPEKYYGFVVPKHECLLTVETTEEHSEGKQAAITRFLADCDPDLMCQLQDSDRMEKLNKSLLYAIYKNGDHDVYINADLLKLFPPNMYAFRQDFNNPTALIIVIDLATYELVAVLSPARK